MVFFDTRNTVQDDDDPAAMIDAYYAFSNDRGAHWQEFRLTPESFSSADDGGVHGMSEQFIGDYLGLARTKNKVFPCYVSTQDGDPDIYTHVVEILGGCCLTTSCTSLSKEECEGEDGVFLGSGIACSTNDCEPDGIPDECQQPRACCLPPPEGGCEVTTESCCDGLEGDYNPIKLQCTLSACPQWNGPGGGPNP